MKRGSIIGILLIAVAIGIIVSLTGDASNYVGFEEAKTTASEKHVIGVLEKGREMVYNPQVDANYFAFYMKDEVKGDVCKVVFNGTKPQDFEKSEKIVLVGKMEGDEFHASKILMKCPSKYNKDQVEVSEVTASKKI